MLYFCSKYNSKIRAVYTGRFAFVAQADSNIISELINSIRANALLDQNKHDDFSVHKLSVYEEFYHSRLFLYCNTGLVLIGIRWLIRFLWLFFRSRDSVIWYYKMRAIFYAIMYPIHESIVEEYFESKKSLKFIKNNDSTNKEILKKADNYIKNKWIQNISLSYVLLVMMLWPILKWIGWILSRDFTVISQEFKNGILYEKNHPVSGIINKAGSIGNENANLTERIFNFIKIDTIKHNTFIDDWYWMLLKFRAEHDIWNTVVDISKYHTRTRQTFTNSFNEYISNIIGFVTEWVELKDVTPNIILVRIINKSISKKLLLKPPLNWENQPQLIKLINFFHLHGN